MKENKQLTTTTEETQTAIQQQQPPYGVHLESTGKGYKISTSVHCESIEKCRQATLQLLIGVETDLKNHNLPIAPMVVSGNGAAAAKEED